MAIKDEVAQIRKRMEKAIDDIRKELASIRTGRASGNPGSDARHGSAV